MKLFFCPISDKYRLMSKMKVLITGGNGFLGSHIALAAIHKKGWDVRLFVLPGTNEDVIDEMIRGGEKIYGNVLDYSSILEAVHGVDVVFHTAGSILEWASPEDPVWELNFNGVRNVCRACTEAGVKRLVHTSTAATIGSAPHGELTDEYRMWDMWDTGLYSRSKFLGEKEAFEWGARGLDLVVACPHQILGDWDTGPSTPGRIVLDFLHGRIPAYIDAVSQFVDVDDVAMGHILMAEKGQKGHRYILAGPQPVTAKEFLDFIAEISGLPAPKFKVPTWVVEAVSRPIQWTSDYITKKYPLLTIGNARMLEKNMAASIQKATQELGYEPGDWKQAVVKAVKWFYDHGYIKNPNVKLNLPDT